MTRKPKTDPKAAPVAEGPAKERAQDTAGAAVAAAAPALNSPPTPEAGVGVAKPAVVPPPPEAPAKPAPKAKASGLVVVVTGPKRGRWRIGRHFEAEPVRIPLEELSEDDKAALAADPALSVTTEAE